MPPRRFKTPSLSTIAEGTDSQHEEEHRDGETSTGHAADKHSEGKMDVEGVEDKAVGKGI